MRAASSIHTFLRIKALLQATGMDMDDPLWGAGGREEEEEEEEKEEEEEEEEEAGRDATMFFSSISQRVLFLCL